MKKLISLASLFLLTCLMPSVGLAAQSGDVGTASTIARAVLRGALDTQPSSDVRTAAHSEPAAKSRRSSVDSLSPSDRLPAWRGAALRGSL